MQSRYMPKKSCQFSMKGYAMKIGQDGLYILYGNDQHIIHSPNFNDRKAPISLILLHYTGMESGAAALARLRDPRAEVSSHYVVEEDGRETSAPLRVLHEQAERWKGIWSAADGRGAERGPPLVEGLAEEEPLPTSFSTTPLTAPLSEGGGLMLGQQGYIYIYIYKHRLGRIGRPK